ncbi:MAG: DNA polymerase III subunit beta, partial [Candidatus Woesebacteria bacterium]|nr:DNA polymerase III subunit beta [Candidatus Woesebacteria bacterium]
MKIVVLQENFKKAVALSSHFVSQKAQLPILGNILLKTEKSKLILSSTNLETSVSTSIGAKVEKEGEITINGKTLNDVVTNLSSGNIEIEVEKEQVKLVSGSFKSKILGSNSSDFPKIPTSLDKKTFILNKGEFIDSLSKVLFSVSPDETRPILTGVLFVSDDSTLYLVATDGFRLSEVKIKNKTKLPDFKIIIPKAVLNELSRTTEDGDIEICFDKENNQIVFGISDTVFSSRLIEGEFPDYQKIIPNTSICTVNIDKNELEKAIKLASVFARDSGNIIKLIIMPTLRDKKEELIIKAESANSGNQETSLEIRSEEPINSEINIMFNYRFIEEFLKVVEDDEIQMQV